MRETEFPRSEKLKKYIRYISFYESEEGSREFLVFPNPGAAIALHKGYGFVNQEKNVYRVTDRPNENVQILHVNRIDPVKVQDEGRRETITIVFQPLGINHFIRQNLAELIAANQGDHSYLDLSEYSFRGFAGNVFSESSREGRLAAIEEFLLKKFNLVQIPFVEEAINMLTDLDNPVTIPAICQKIGTSPRNLTRLFNKHICLTPVEFRNIYQFRYSLDKKMESGTKALKDIGYESNYSHSSYMIRMYKKYTGLNPSAFFDKVTVESQYVYLSL